MIKTKYAVWVGAVMMVACAAKMKVDEGGAGGRAAASGAGGDAGRSGAPGSSLELGGGAGEGASDSQSSPATPFAGGQGGRGTDTTGTGGEVDENTTGSRANAAGGYGGSHSNASIPSAAGEGGLRTEAAGAGGDGVGMSCHEDFLGSDATDRPGEGLSSNATGCPSKPPDYASVCQTDEGLVCAYLGSDDRNDYYTECQCVAVSRTELRWDCDVRHNGDFESCPETAPQDGDPCSDPFLSCYYPVRVDCACLTDDDAGDAVWDCEEPASDLPEPTPDVYASLPVGQLSSGEIAAWCDWYLDVMYDGDDSQDAVVRVHGDFAQAMPQNCLGLATNAFLPRLTKALCEQNMALSTCEAPVSELSECVLTFANHCVPAHTGCRRYLDTPGCDGTMIIDNGGCYRNDVSVTGVPIRVRREDTSDWRVPPGTGLDTNPTECPAVAVAVGSPCENEALTCEYGGTDPLDTRKSGKGTEYKTECWCVPTGATELAWDCGDTLEHDIGDCPSTPPETGASCEDTPHASRCSYAPRREYSCGDDEKWEQISPAALPELPASPDRTTLVAELSDPDQSDWCSWLRETFGEATGESEPKPVPADESGFVDVSQYFGIFDDAISLEALLPNWPVDECEKNLSVSSCEAPISELSGCVVSLLNSGTPSPTGCRRYLETPGCFATVVYDIEGVDPDVLMLPDYVEGYRPVPLRVEAPETAAGS